MSRKCEFCGIGVGSYTCPRCHRDYCGLKCYQAPGHSSCSEDFYKDCVRAELCGENLSQESKEKMQQILRRLNDEAGRDEDSEEGDSDDDDEVEDLEDRLRGVDLDDTERVWSLLTQEERRQFTDLVQTEQVLNILPDYTPWWSQQFPVPRIQEVDRDEELLPEYRRLAPPIWEDIPKFSDLCRQPPSDYVQYGLLNLLYAYAYAVRYLYGDYGDSPLRLVEIVETLAASLQGQNFDLADTALEAAASLANQEPDLAVSLEMARAVKRDVYQLVRGPNREEPTYYILAGLSDLRCQYLKAIQELKKKSQKKPPAGDGRFSERPPQVEAKAAKLHLKKIEFYLAWAKEYGSVYQV